MMQQVLTAMAMATAIFGLSSQAHAITWTSFGGHDYAFVATASNFSWSSAKTAAESQATGGYVSYLASITSQDENAFVYGIIPSDYKNNGSGQYYQVWLGGHQAAGQTSRSSGWAWESGDAWTFSAWASGEPSDGGSVIESSKENYLTMNRYGSWTWNDVPNTTPVVGYMVERMYVPDGGSSLILLGAGMVSLMAFRRKEA